MNTVANIKASSTAKLLAMQELINQELIRRQQRIAAIDERLKIQDLPLRAATRTTFLLDIKRHIPITISFNQAISVQNLLYQLPVAFWGNFSKNYPKYYSEIKDAFLKNKIDLKNFIE
ncbi:hypothetical protein GCM10028805_21930 [Spirosoma harenae]